MNEIVKKVKNPHVLQRLNDIWVYLKVSRLSDITNKQGNLLREEILNATTPNSSPFDWPKRRKPIQRNIDTWKTVLISIFKSSTGIFLRNLGAPLPSLLIQHENCQTLLLYLQSYPPHYRTLLGNFQPNSDDYQQLLQWMIEGTIC